MAAELRVAFVVVAALVGTLGCHAGALPTVSETTRSPRRQCAGDFASPTIAGLAGSSSASQR